MEVQVTSSGDRDPGFGARSRLRLILGMRILEQLERDPTAVGSRIPSIRAIAGATCVHRNTAAAAISELRGFGLVTCTVGSGCAISSPPSVHDAPVPLYCAEPELASLLAGEIGRSVSSRGWPSTAGLAFQSLDRPPLQPARCVPLAPRGLTLSALRMLTPGSVAIIVSRSATVRGLVSHSIRAIHGCRVSAMTSATDQPAAHVLRPPPFARSTVLFHDPDVPVDCPAVAAWPLLIAPPKVVDTG